MKIVLKNIFLFYQTPELGKSLEYNKLRLFWKVLLIYIGSLLIIAPLSYTIAKLIPILTHYKNPLDVLHSKMDKVNTIYGYYQYLIVLIIMPTVEELIYRLPLLYNKRNGLISLSVIIIYSLISFYKLNYSFNFSLALFILCGTGILLVCFLYQHQKPVSRWPFIVSALSFGIAHIANFGAPHIGIFYFYIFLVLPQILVGFILGYVRVKLGILYSIGMHILINIPAMLVQFLRH